MLALGNLILNTSFIQAPLSGYSDYAMRRLALDFGAPLTFSGVMLAKSAAHRKLLRKPAFRPHDDEHPVGAQVLGNDPIIMAAGAKALEEAGYDIIDLNFACPAPKVIRRRRGGYLLKEPQTVMEIVRRVREAVKCPITMKLRTGYDSSKQSCDHFFRIVSDASEQNVDALVIHARTVVQKFSGEVDWPLLARLKHQFPKTTLIGSGDLFEAQTIVGRLKSTKLDGILIARGAIGNPWIYTALHSVLNGQPVPQAPDLAEQAAVMRRHFEMIDRLYEAIKAIRYFRKFLVRYCRLHPKRKQAQKTLLAANSKAQLFAGIEKWYGNHNNELIKKE